MNETLESLVEKEGMAAVLAALRNLVSEEADELEELGEDAAWMEKVARHTPEPWTCEVNANSVDVLLGPDKPSTEVFRQRLYGGEDHDMDAVAIADARLIAAAPRLRRLASLTLRTIWDADRHGWSEAERENLLACAEQLKAEIAKADGQ